MQTCWSALFFLLFISRVSVLCFPSFCMVSKHSTKLYTGKTTLATSIVASLNASYFLHHPSHLSNNSSSDPPLAVYLPMDGFHHTRATLSSMPNPQKAHAERGAPYTFDSSALLAFLRSLRDGREVRAPSFDHAVKDPKAEDIRVPPGAKIVVMEGLYLNLDPSALSKPTDLIGPEQREEWSQVAECFDEQWFIDVEREVAERRLIERHVVSGVCRNREEAEGRATGSDRRNADVIFGARGRVDEWIVDVDRETGWTESVVREEE
jgi:pantothenate kinase